MSGLKLAVETTCPMCKKKSYVQVNKERYLKWKFGEGLIQNLLPDLSVDDREKLVSGVCVDCWNKTFSEE